jgi:hypothetical protein
MLRQPFLRYFAHFSPLCVRRARLLRTSRGARLEITRHGMSLLTFLSLQLEPQHPLLRFTQRPLCFRGTRL